MSIKAVIKRYEDEEKAIKEKMAALMQRADVVELMLKELRSASGAGGGRKKPAKKGGRKKSTSRKKGGLTVRDAILKTVANARSALPAKDIIDGAVKLSNGAVASIRTQINSLAKGGWIKQVPYEGRGFRYAAGSGKAAPKKVVKKVVKKAATKPAADAKPEEKKKG